MVVIAMSTLDGEARAGKVAEAGTVETEMVSIGIPAMTVENI
jgi:hypothetical protein